MKKLAQTMILIIGVASMSIWTSVPSAAMEAGFLGGLMLGIFVQSLKD